MAEQLQSVYMLLGVVIIAIFVITFLSHIPFYFIMRGRMRRMKSLADEFRLSFTSQLPNFFVLLTLYFFRDLKLNRLEGTIAGRPLLIFDLYHFNLLQILKYYQRETVVEIDGKTVKEGYKSFSLIRSSLTSIEELHRILKGLKQSQGAFAPED
ncbi:MAG: hypothetical protein Q8O83_02780 [bacterium]|nr:hypothetical protein [bacterium]